MISLASPGPPHPKVAILPKTGTEYGQAVSDQAESINTFMGGWLNEVMGIIRPCPDGMRGTRRRFILCRVMPGEEQR